MNTTASGNYTRIIAFVLVAVTLLCTFGFVAEGWQPPSNEQDSGNTGNQSGEADDNKEEIPSPPQVYIPEFINFITGIETTEELSRSRETCFIMDATSPLYGISGADLVIEFPIENGTTRLAVFTANSKELGKIGSLCKTRGFISNLAKNFGAVLVSAGNDDTVEYNSLDISSSFFDLSVNSGYHYTEYTHFTYTNGALISAGLSNTNIVSSTVKSPSLPYLFNDFGDDEILGSLKARTVVFPYSENSETSLYYSDEDGKYVISRNGSVKVDMLTDSTVCFDNAFVLFADSVTYESADSSELVLDTIGGGTGYYFTNGTAIGISWKTDKDGNMRFYNDSGEQLKINRGSSYVSFMKSSRKDSVSIS